MEKLIPNTQFGFYVRSLETNDYKKLELRENYDMFLNQKLELWMFVPCKFLDGVWVVLEMPKEHFENRSLYFKELQEYQEAKDRVLFEGFKQNVYNNTGSFEIIDNTGFQVCAYKALPDYFLWLGCPEERTIESAIKFHDFILTPTAQKQIGV